MSTVQKYNFVRDWLIRVKRLINHFAFPFFNKFRNPFPPNSFLEWAIDFLVYLLDILLFPEFYTFFHTKIINRKIRKLNAAEQQLAMQIFGNNIRYDRVLINNQAKFISPKYASAFVTFNIINYHKSISDPIFIHEMTHIWQYQHFGSVYISKSLNAQKSKEGYDYGGIEGLYHAFNNGKKLLDFNFEQQADIIEDHFRKSSSDEQVSLMEKTIFNYYQQQLDV